MQKERMLLVSEQRIKSKVYKGENPFSIDVKGGEVTDRG
jgi:hypothetical protein